MTDSNLVPCSEPGNIQDLNIDPIPPFCREGKFELGSGTIDHKPFIESQRDVTSQDMSWLEDATMHKLGEGRSALCDPQQTGHIVNEQGMEYPNRNVLYRYSKSIRGTDEAMKDMFSDIIVEDVSGKAHNVPINWGSQEKAVAFVLQSNIRKDESVVVDRIPLPMLSIYPSGYNFNQNRYIYHKAINYLRDHNDNWRPGFTVKESYDRDTVFGVSRGIPLDISYTLYAWTLYEEDMNQIMTQVLTKFSPMAYIRVRGVSFEIGVKIDSIRSNVDLELGDKKTRMFKHEFSFTAETFVSQPIVRKKSVLKTRIEMTDSTNEEDITEVLSRLEQAVKEFE